MKGIIFIALNEVIEDNFGLTVWDEVLQEVQPESEGIYISAESYSDQELFALVGALSTKLAIPVPTLIATFGEALFPKLAHKFPVFLEKQPSLKHFLMTIHDVIHVEVKKLFTEPNLPTIEYIDPGNDGLTMIYRSKRKLCHLSEGLIKGAANEFKTSVSIVQPLCMHEGADHCQLDITFNTSN